MRKVICSIVCALLLVSCGEYNKILKSTDYELKYDYAKKAFERKKYMQAATLLEELVAIFKGTDRAEESLYLLARSYYLNKDYITSGEYLGNYMGNNYQSAIITAQNALKEYPYTRYKETLSMLILKSKYQEAVQSIEEKKPERFRDVIDEYYSFINDYPSGEYSKEAENIFKVANKYVKD